MMKAWYSLFPNCTVLTDHKQHHYALQGQAMEKKKIENTEQQHVYSKVSTVSEILNTKQAHKRENPPVKCIEV